MHSSVGERLDRIEARLDRIDRAKHLPKASGLGLNRSENRLRLFAWALTTFSLLGFLTGWTDITPSMTLFFSLALGSGIILILALSGIFGPSGTHLRLAQEHRASRILKAHDVHRPTWSRISSFWRLSPYQFYLTTGFLVLSLLFGWALSLVTDSFLTVVPTAFALMILAVHTVLSGKRQLSYLLVGILTVLLCVTSDPVIILSLALTAAGVIWIAAWEKGECEIAILAGSSLVLVTFSQVYWNISLLTESSRACLLAGAVMGLVLSILPYSCMRRSLKDREWARISMILTPLLAALAVTVVGPYSYAQNLAITLLVIIFGYAFFGYLAWLGHGRFSYVKYFLTVALAALLALMYFYFDTSSVTLMWFIAAVTVTAVGFGLPSVSARYLGLGLLAIALFHYLFLVLNVGQVSGLYLLHDRVWLGLVFALFLPALGIWYQAGGLSSAEKRLTPAVVQGTALMASFILMAVSYLELTMLSYGLVWLVTGYLLWWYGRVINRDLIRQIGIGELVFGALVSVVSFFTLSLSMQLIVFLVIALILIGLGFRYSSRQK